MVEDKAIFRERAIYISAPKPEEEEAEKVGIEVEAGMEEVAGAKATEQPPAAMEAGTETPEEIEAEAEVPAAAGEMGEELAEEEVLKGEEEVEFAEAEAPEKEEEKEEVKPEPAPPSPPPPPPTPATAEEKPTKEEERAISFAEEYKRLVAEYKKGLRREEGKAVQKPAGGIPKPEVREVPEAPEKKEAVTKCPACGSDFVKLLNGTHHCQTCGYRQK
jgi:hypothetical protein